MSAEALNTIPGYDAIGTAGECRFSPLAALHAIRFIEGHCTFAKGEWDGKPALLAPWQLPIVGNLFGWLRPDGSRRYRRLAVWVPRKSGKTELAAWICLYCGTADDEPTPEICTIAAEKMQAREVFDRARRMVLKSPTLGPRIVTHKNALVWPSSGGNMMPLSSEGLGKHGKGPSLFVADELHAMGNNRDIWEAMETSQGARRQPLAVSITTSGIERESLEFAEYEYAVKVRDGGVANEAFLPVIHEAGEEADWRSPETWRRANPALGITTPITVYEEACRKAVDEPRTETSFRTFFCNQRPTVGKRWLRLSDWNRRRTEPFDEAMLRAMPCFLGMDFGTVDDLASISALWFAPGIVYVRSWSYAPQAKADERAKKKRVPYLEWAEQGWLTLTPGEATDFTRVEDRAAEIAAHYWVVDAGYDPSNASGVGQKLENRGVRMHRVAQSYQQLSTPCKQLESSISGKGENGAEASFRLAHEGNPLLTWCISNVCVETGPGDAIRPSKKLAVEKIDPVTAMVIAWSVALNSPARKIGDGPTMHWL